MPALFNPALHMSTSFSLITSCNALLFLLTFKVDGRGVGAALAGCGLDGVGGVVACARRPGYGTPLGDNGPLTEGNDRVLIFQAPVVIQRMQPSLPDTTAANTPTSASITVQLLHERNMEAVRRTLYKDVCLSVCSFCGNSLTECSEQE